MIRVLASLGQLYSLGWVNQFSPIHDLEGFMTWSFPESRCVLIGMVHLDPLPGSHQWNGDMQAILDSALRDAEILLEGGCDGLIVENMGDAPYLKGSVPPETVAAMTLATQKVVSLAAPVGIQVLAGANREALGIAAAVGAQFIRVEGFAYAHVADEGWIDACAGPLLRARKSIAPQVSIWADVQKKHAAHAVTQDLSLEQLCEGASFCGADVLVITGSTTGDAASINDVEAAARVGLPVVVGSGVTPQNVEGFKGAAAVIVGSALKSAGQWQGAVELDRVQAMARALKDA